MADSVGGNITTTGVITVGTPIFGEIETLGDQDWYRVTLTAGTHYFISLNGDKTGPQEWVSYPKIRVFDSTGNLVEISDDRDWRDSAFIDFVPNASGDYFISAGDAELGTFVLSIDTNIPESTATGAFLEEVFTATGYIRPSESLDDNWYRIEVREDTSNFILVTDAGLGDELGQVFIQLFDENGRLVTASSSSYLDISTVDDGTYYVSVGGTSAAASGYYDIGLEYDLSTSDFWQRPIDAIRWPSYQGVPHPDGGPTEIKVFFVPGGTNIDDGLGAFTSTGWDAAERAAAMAAFATFEAIANVKFKIVTSAQSADYMMVENPGAGGTGIEDNLGYWRFGPLLVDYNNTDVVPRGLGVFNSAHSSWTANALKPGGYGFITLIHELGHGLGLKHPHDHGGGGGLMHGVALDKPEDRGTFGLNQGVYTMMSYNDGWETQPGVSGATSPSHGWEASPMALDVAQLQRIWGIAAHSSGNTVYSLPGSNAAGTGFRAIWDTGGTDTIKYTGSKNATISLQEATLDTSKTGGGVVSYVEGVRGGYTIANGARIENAFGGSGNDWLQGSLWANILDGGAGRDVVDYSSRFRSVQVTLSGSVAATVKIDGKAEDKIKNIENVVGGTAGDTIMGDNLSNWITGGGGKDALGSAGGYDRFIFSIAAGPTNADTISDFYHGRDKLCLDDAFYKAVGPTLTSGEFYAKNGATKAHDSDDRIIYNKLTGALYFDADGFHSSKGPLLFATLSNKAVLDHTDFLIV